MGKDIPREDQARSAGGSADENSSTRSASDRGRGGRGGGATKTESSQNLPKLVAVEVPGESEDKAEARKKKNAERQKKYREEKKNKNLSAAKKTAKQSSLDTSQLEILILTTSSIISSRDGMGVWQLSPEEVKQIVQPLSNIMARHADTMGVVSEYADYIALIVACATIFIPKYLIWKATRPKKESKPNVRQNQNPDTNGGDSARTVTVSDRPDNRKSTDVHTNVSKELSQLIPAVSY